jgi:hypothetical protein
MSSATENYGRLKLLSERLVHPAAENVLETYTYVLQILENRNILKTYLI